MHLIINQLKYIPANETAKNALNEVENSNTEPVNDKAEFTCIKCEFFDPNCLDKPTETDTCVSSKNECYIYLEDDLVSRGCADEIVPSQNMTTCSSRSNCNDQKIEIQRCLSVFYWRDIGGMYPPEKKSKEYSKQCPFAIDPLGCFHKESIFSVRKGCVSELTEIEYEECFNNKENYKTCNNSDNCNSKNYFLTCRYDESNSDHNFYGAFSYLERCDDYNDVCFERFAIGSILERGCLAIASKDAIEDCNSKETTCKICEDKSSCNNHIAKDICVSCSSQTDKNCRDNPKNVTSRVICDLDDFPEKSQFSGCYLKIEDDIVTRGCVRNLDHEDLKVCTSSDFDYCQICHGANCNEKAGFRQTCHFCNGSIVSQCSYLDHSNSTGLSTKTCEDYASSCFIGIDENGLTNRGCSYATPDKSKYSNGMEICYGDKCNDYIFPTDRHLCYQCENCPSINSNEDPKPCRSYSQHNQCYTIFDESNIHSIFIHFIIKYWI